MSLRVTNVRLRIDESEAALPARLARVLGLRLEEIARWRILRKALDARDKDALQFVYTAEVVVPQDEDRVAAHANRTAHPKARVERFHEEPFVLPPPGAAPLESRPVVVAWGPGGLAAADFLAEQGYRPLVLERGRAVRDRIPDGRAFDEGRP